MKNKKISFFVIVAAIAMVLGINACSKSGTTSNVNTSEAIDVNAAESATAGETMYDDVFDIISQACEQSNLNPAVVINTIGPVKTLDSQVGGIPTSFSTINGATITLSPADTSTFPKSMIIDYGNGITSANGITRKGSITVSLSGKLRTAGTLMAATFNNYSVNSFALGGTYTLTPNKIVAGAATYSATVSNGTVTFPNGTGSTYTGSETFTQVGGASTITVTDDTYNITGDYTLANSNIGNITGTITKALTKTVDCKNVTSGTVAFSYNNLNGLLDYGSGACDASAILTFGGTATTISLVK